MDWYPIAHRYARRNDVESLSTLTTSQLRETERCSMSDALNTAAMYDSLEAFEYMIGKGMSPTTGDMKCVCPIHIAGWNGSMKVLQYILSRYPESVEYTTGDGETALSYAARGGHINAVLLLLVRGSDFSPTGQWREWNEYFLDDHPEYASTLGKLDMNTCTREDVISSLSGG